MLATKLLNGQNNCVASLLSFKLKPVFSSVQVLTSLGLLSASGAVGDLVDSPQSQALTNINNPTQPSIPVRTALIAGTLNSSNTTVLMQDGNATKIRNICGLGASNELATKLTPSAWPTLFSADNNASDAIVGLSSQLARLGTGAGTVFDGNIHSPGTRELGFNGPSVLDAGPVPQQVITLLNIPITVTAVFNPLNP